MSRDDMFRQAVAHHRRGELDRAGRIYARILRERPEDADCLHLLGLVRAATSDHDEARRLIDRAIALAPNAILYRINLAETLLRQGQATQAEAVARDAVAIAPADDAALRSLAGVLRHQRRYEEACDLLKRALTVAPPSPATLTDIGATLNYLGLNEQSEKYTRLALRAAPDNPGLWNNLGLALKGQRRLDEAAQAFTKAAATPLGRFGLAQTLLLAGRYRDAWPLFDARLDFMAPRELAHLPAWTGEPLAGRTLLVQTEQGVGDTIMMGRFLEPLSQMGGRIVVRAPSAQRDLVAAMAGSHDVVDAADAVAGDVWVPMMSLPRWLGVDDVAQIPPPARLAVPPPIRAGARRRAGLVWRGNPAHRYDGCRSMRPDTLRPLIAARPDIEWLSVYKGPNDAAEAAELGVPHALADSATFLETAERMAGLDLLVTVDTAVAHLAGSVSLPAIVMINKDCDWRWLADGTDSPWYPQARVLRQDVEGEWTAVIGRAIDAVAALLPRPTG